MNQRRLILFASCYVIWCLLNWMPHLQALVIGIPVAVLVTMLTERIPVGMPGHLFFQPNRLAIFLFHYLPVFWWQHFVANVEVAFRVMHPKLPIRPAVVRVKTELKSDMGLTILANSLSLVPGTTTVHLDAESGTLYLHCMVVPPGNIDGAAKKLVLRFEKILSRIFE